eukprot:TRINITY_DN4075_c0_g1_i1.p1 TRINITY_DN4075_c0_g1~~TRINITY_DN4075_c0_g1_i1.p1  ORF type:complete len:613 (+),score=84.79 TRINITY_DN4075_c0_g1_i1:23-1861(+)
MSQRALHPELRALLQRLQLQMYEENLRQEEVFDITTLRVLQEKDLKEIIKPLGPRRLLSQALRELQEPNPGRVYTSSPTVPVSQNNTASTPAYRQPVTASYDRPPQYPQHQQHRQYQQPHHDYHQNRAFGQRGGQPVYGTGFRGRGSQNRRFTSMVFSKMDYNRGGAPRPHSTSYSRTELSVDELFACQPAAPNVDAYATVQTEVFGTHPPNPVASFDDLDMSDAVKENTKRMHYKVPTPIQKYAIPVSMNGRDFVACAETGSGKTAAFMLPLISLLERNGGPVSTRCPQALVLTPTRELAMQTYDEARKFSHLTSIRPCLLVGGIEFRHQQQMLANGFHFIVATPGRLIDALCRPNMLFLREVRLLVLDEADRMLSPGSEAIITAILTEYDMPKKTQRQTLVYTATLPEAIFVVANDLLNDEILITVGKTGAGSGASGNVRQVVELVEREQRLQRLEHWLETLVQGGQALIFVTHKGSGDFVSSHLRRSFSVGLVHADRPMEERERALVDFKSGRINILIGTDLLARGLDFPGLQYVINYEMAPTICDYIHRIGRTGRMNASGTAVTFFSRKESGHLETALLSCLREHLQAIPGWAQETEEMTAGQEDQEG